MTEKKQYTAAIIGCGRIGFSLGFDKKREQPASHTMALAKNRRIRICSGCDTNEENLAEWHKYVKDAKVFSKTEELLAECKPDIITVAVNEDSHLSCALDAIKAKPALVILEKPVALNVEQGNQIVEAAEKYNVPVMVNHERRFALDYQAARSYMAKIGEIQSIHANLFSGLRVYSKEDEKTGAYSLLHDGTHLIDIVLFFLEELEAAAGYTATGDSERAPLLQNPVLTSVYYDKEKKDKDGGKIVRNLSVHFTSPECPDVYFTISGRSRFFGFEIDIVGTLGRIHIGNGFVEFYLRKQSKLYTGFYSLTKDKSAKVPRKTKYFANMVQNAVDFLDGKAGLGSTLADGMNVLKIIDEIRNMLKNTAE